MYKGRPKTTTREYTSRVATSDSDSDESSYSDNDLWIEAELQDGVSCADCSYGPLTWVMVEVWWIWNECIKIMFLCLEMIPGWPYTDDQMMEKCWIKYNPIFWLLVAGYAMYDLPGHIFHMIFGQGCKVRPDETKTERTVRIMWIYCYTGAFMITAAMAVVALGSLTSTEDTIGYLLAILLDLAYIFGNVNLMCQMHMGSTWGMRAAACGQITFGLGLCLICIVGLVRRFSGMSISNGVSFLAWCMRCCYAVTMFIALCGYWPLMRMSYDDQKTRHVSLCLSVAVSIAIGFIPCVLVLVCFLIGGDEVWVGLMG